MYARLEVGLTRGFGGQEVALPNRWHSQGYPYASEAPREAAKTHSGRSAHHDRKGDDPEPGVRPHTVSEVPDDQPDEQ